MAHIFHRFFKNRSWFFTGGFFVLWKAIMKKNSKIPDMNMKQFMRFKTEFMEYLGEKIMKMVM